MGCAFLSSNVFKALQLQTGKKGPLFVEINGFFLKADVLPSWQDNEVGLSSFLRDSLQISKLD